MRVYSLCALAGVYACLRSRRTWPLAARDWATACRLNAAAESMQGPGGTDSLTSNHQTTTLIPALSLVLNHHPDPST